MTKKLQGYFGGTFDPIHQGHLYLATYLLKQMPFESITFIPCHQSPHRLSPTANLKDRLAMLALALKNHPHLSIDTCEIDRGSLSYTVDTLAKKRDQQGADTPICLILSTESFSTFYTWKAPERIISLAHLVIVQRKNSTLPDNPLLTNLLNRYRVDDYQALQQKPSGYLYLSSLTPPPISATQIRHSLANKTIPPKNCLPQAVLKYITQHQLYQHSTETLNCYLVGGAVRDKLLGKTPKERDWVVVGSTPDTLIRKGYKPVGKSFPVFLHPVTREEYALARTEKKIAEGYKGFNFYTAPTVTLLEDLKRRDITINAIAQSPLTGALIDPYGGAADIKNRTIRHVSDAFVEDPVRILRVARIAAKLSNFTIHPKTYDLMRQMVVSGETDALVPERTWQELNKALGSQSPERFFQILAKCRALESVFGGASLKDFDLDALKHASKLSAFTSPIETVCFSAVLNRCTSKKLERILHHLKPPKAYTDLAKLTIKHLPKLNSLMILQDPESILSRLEALDPWRRPDRFHQLLAVYSAIRYDQPEEGEKISHYLLKLKNLTARIKARALKQGGLDGLQLAKALRQARIAAIQTALEEDPFEPSNPTGGAM